MRVLKNIAIRLTGNFLAQKLLRKNLEVSSYLMGIGAGTNVKESGELVLVKQILHSKKIKQLFLMLVQMSGCSVI